MRKIVLDIETKNMFEDVGKADPALLDLAVVGIYDSGTDRYETYLEGDLPKLWPILEQTDLIVGFNSDHFDIPLLNKYCGGDLSRIRSVDLLKEMRRAIGRRLKLDTLAEATLGRGKTGTGLEALRWWREGKIDRVREYCLEDVRLTKELYDYARMHGSLKYRDASGVREAKLDTSSWETAPGPATGALPF